MQGWTKRLFGTVMAATAMLPGAAIAQRADVTADAEVRADPGPQRAPRGEARIERMRQDRGARNVEGGPPEGPPQRGQGDRGGFDRGRPDQPRSDQARSDQARPDQTRPDQTRFDRPRRDQVAPAPIPGAGGDRRYFDAARQADARRARDDAPRFDRQDDGRGRRDDDRARGNGQRFDDRGRSDRNGWNGNDRGRPDLNRNDLNRNDLNRNDLNRNDRNWNGRNGNDGNRNDRGWGNRDWNGRDGWNGRDAGGRDGWNRGWRSDRRYDWNDWRLRNRQTFRLPRYYAPYGWSGGYRRFSIGIRLGAPLFAQSYWIGQPDYYRLPPAYGPYRWVRYYNDALLVDVRYGTVVDVVYDIFW